MVAARAAVATRAARAEAQAAARPPGVLEQEPMAERPMPATVSVGAAATAVMAVMAATPNPAMPLAEMAAIALARLALVVERVRAARAQGREARHRADLAPAEVRLAARQAADLRRVKQ